MKIALDEIVLVHTTGGPTFRFLGKDPEGRRASIEILATRNPSMAADRDNAQRFDVRGENITMEVP